jgi:SagB-type dehydrogenase family enzyme
VTEEELQLPRPCLKGRVSLEEAIAARRSVREFRPEALRIDEVGQLLWAAEGITGSASYLRAHPSAGGLHPLAVYVVLPDGIFEHRPRGHRLRRVADGDQRRALSEAAYGQSFIAVAGCTIAIAAVYPTTTGKYRERGRTRYVPMDAAHAAQNVLLQAVALGLGAVPVGAFDDAAVQRVLGLPADQTPLYLIPVGKPR